jgi:signal transduction histidine kinase
LDQPSAKVFALTLLYHWRVLFDTVLRHIKLDDGARRAWIGVGAPILALVLVVVMLAVVTFWGFARDQDRAYAETSSRLVASAIDGRGRSLASVALDYANWDDAYQNISVRWDQSWVDGNIYSSVADGMVLFQPNGDIRYAWLSEEFAGKSDITDAAVAAAVEIPSLYQLRGANIARETSARSFAVINGQLALIAIAPITPEDDASRLAPNAIRNDFIGLVDIITPAELIEIAASLDLRDLHLSPAGSDHTRNTVTLPLTSADGATEWELDWRHMHPGGASFLRQIWPVVLGLLMIGALTVLVARRLVSHQINAMAEARALHESGRTKAEFLARVSHELRTPLNSIIGYAEIIEEENERPETRTDAKHVIDAARHLNMMLNDIFDQSKIHAGRMDLRPEVLPVAGFLAELHGLVLRTAKDNGVKVSTSSPAGAGYVYADHIRLRQCMLNLIGNAIKFAPKGEVLIRARQQPQGKREMIVFDVIDNGVGISKADQAKLFRPFGQPNRDISEAHGGTGLGLSISRDLARGMGGDITVVSEPGKGSTFSLSIPVATAQALRAA